jgi:hypothetical protein
MRRPGLALAILLAATTAAPAAVTSQRGFDLRYDESVWRAVMPVPPVVLALECIAVVCGSDARLMMFEDDRPLLQPGAGAFGPGATASATLADRAADLVPGTRITAVEATSPATFAAFTGYRGRYSVQDPTLTRRDMLHAVVRLPTGLLQVAFIAPALDDSAENHFVQLLDGLAETGTLSP